MGAMDSAARSVARLVFYHGGSAKNAVETDFSNRN